MSKTICIKTRNKNISKYLLNELEYFEIKEIYVSCYDFKYYNNIIVHYIGKNIPIFLNRISCLLAYAVTDFYEPLIIKRLINTNYFYFSSYDKNTIYNLCLTNIDFSNSISLFNTVSNTFYDFFSENKYVILDGFVSFRLKEYIKQLDSTVDMCVNKFIIDREFNEFIKLLKTYIHTTPCCSNIIHLVYKNEETMLLDSEKNIIEFNKNLNNKKYVSDISFSSNDFALNSLLTLLPEKLYIHLIDKDDDFINTLKLIFDNRAFICNDCNICNLYKCKQILH